MRAFGADEPLAPTAQGRGGPLVAGAGAGEPLAPTAQGRGGRGEDAG